MSRSKNISFSEGETWVIDASFTDSSGDPLDLTGASIAWTVATGPGKAALVSATTGNGLITIVSETDGTAQIVVPYASHSSATPRGYLHECRVVLADGEITVQFDGKLTVRDSLFIV